MKIRPAKIVSGGQTGVDRAALDAAIALGIPHGGWCPRGRLAEDGRIPDSYRLLEADSPEYHVRTELNVVHSDGTLILFVGSSDRGASIGSSSFGTPAGSSGCGALVGSSGGESASSASTVPEPCSAEADTLQAAQHTGRPENQQPVSGAYTDDSEGCKIEASDVAIPVGTDYGTQLSGGTELTFRLANRHRRPVLVVNLNRPPPADTIYQWLEVHRIAVLNIAGPRESQSPGIASRTFKFLVDLFGSGDLSSG